MKGAAIILIDYHQISSTCLFSGCTPEQTQAILSCLKAQTRCFEKGEIILRAGEVVSYFGIVLSGSVTIESDDVWGNKSILDQASAGQVFAETYSCLPTQPLMVSVVAAQPSEILFLHTASLLHPCNCICHQHGILIQNLIKITAQKNLNLSRRIFHTRPKSIRERLLSYLSFQAILQKSMEFEIPFNRQQLADYLSIDRSALSNELSKMQKEGLLTVRRSHFLLHADSSNFFEQTIL